MKPIQPQKVRVALFVSEPSTTRLAVVNIGVTRSGPNSLHCYHWDGSNGQLAALDQHVDRAHHQDRTHDNIKLGKQHEPCAEGSGPLCRQSGNTTTFVGTRTVAS